MPSIGDINPYDPSKMWNGTAWVAKGIAGSNKTGEQVAGELGFKGKLAKDAPAPKSSGGGSMSLADYAAKNRVKSLEDQAEAVEGEKKKKPTPTPTSKK